MIIRIYFIFFDYTNFLNFSKKDSPFKDTKENIEIKTKLQTFITQYHEFLLFFFLSSSEKEVLKKIDSLLPNNFVVI